MTEEYSPQGSSQDGGNGIKGKIRGTSAGKGAAQAARHLDLLDQSHLVVAKSGSSGSGSGSTTLAGRSSTTSSGATAASRIAARREAAEKKAATKRFGASGKSTGSASTSRSRATIPESVSPSSPTRMQRGKAFPLNTRAGGYKSPGERARAHMKRKGGDSPQRKGTGGDGDEGDQSRSTEDAAAAAAAAAPWPRARCGRSRRASS